MKKVTIILLLLMIFTSQNLFSQRFLGGIVAGVNLSQVDGDEVYGFYKVGANCGALLSLPLDQKKHWSVSLELLYSQKGSYKKYSAVGSFDTLTYASSMFNDVDRTIAFDPKMKCKLNLDYVEVPLMVHYEDHNTGWAIGAGFSWGRLVRAKEIYNGFARTTNVRSKTYSTNDWAVLGDLRIRIWKGLKLGVRYQYSLKSIRKIYYTTIIKSWGRNQYNSTISVRLMYIFNEKFVKNEKGKWTKDLTWSRK